MRRAALSSLLVLASGCALFVRPQPAQPQPQAAEAEVHAVSVASIDSGAIPAGLSPYWDLVRAGGPLRVGINRAYPPFGVPTDPAKLQPGEPALPLAGFDVDLALHLGQTLGVPVELVPIRSQEAAERLRDQSIDLALAGLTRTVQRAAQVNFSAPYLTVSQAALVERHLAEGARGTDEERRRDTLASYLDLRGVTGISIGVARGTRPHRLAASNFPDAKIVAYPSIEEASRALVAGDVNAIVHDDPYVRVWAMFHPGQAGRFRALLEPATAEPICIAMRKGDLEFLRFLDAYAGEVAQDGTVDRLYRRHFVQGAWLRVAAAQEAAQ